MKFLLLTGSPNRIIEDTVQLYGGKYLQKTDANLLNELKRFPRRFIQLDLWKNLMLMQTSCIYDM